MTIQILYEDDHLAALSKPSGQLVIPGRGDLPGEPLIHELERRMGRKPFVVHRLDRGASGVVLFAKDAPTHRHLSLQFEKRQVKKSYVVLAQGQVESGGQIDQPLRSFGSGRMGIHPEGKPSLTEYKVHQRVPAGQAGLPGATLLEVTPHTGRRHQIRVHLYSIHHPVMGDTLYGKERPVGGAPRLMLHAWKLEFEKPSGEVLRLVDELPRDFTDFLQVLSGTFNVGN